MTAKEIRERAKVTDGFVGQKDQSLTELIKLARHPWKFRFKETKEILERAEAARSLDAYVLPPSSNVQAPEKIT